MENIKNLSVIFTGNTTGLSAAFTKVMAESDALKANLAGTNAESAGFGSKLVASLPAIGAAVVAAGVVVTGVSMKMAADFQQQMTYIRTDAGDTTDDINKLSKSVLDMTSQFNSKTLAEGLYHLASLGLRGADALNALNIAQQMASVGGANLEDTASALGAALVTGIKGVQDYSSAAGTLDAIIGAGNMRMNDLVAALGTGVLPVFKNAGLTITDFGAALATLTDNGMQADEAATRLKMTISLMEAPSKKAQKVLADIGVTSNQLGMDMQTKGLIPALQDLNKHLLDTFGTSAEGRQATAQALTEMFGGGRSSAAIQTLLDQVDRVQNKFSQIGAQGSPQEFQLKVSEQQFTPLALAKTAINKVESAMIEWGIVVNNFSMTHLPKFLDAVKQVFDRVANFLKPSLEALWNTVKTKLGPSLERLWVQVKPLVPLIGEALVGALWLIINGINILVNVISIAINVVSDIIEWFKNLGNVFTWVRDKLGWLKDNWLSLLGEMLGFIATLPIKIPIFFIEAFVAVLSYLASIDWGKVFGGILTSIGGVKTGIWNAIKRVFDDIMSLDWGKLMRNVGSGIANGIIDLINGAIKGAFDGVPVLKDHIPHIPHFALGTNYAPGGIALVGENGPELVNLPRGSQVANAEKTKQVTNSSGGSVNLTVNVGVVAGNNVQDLAATIYRELQRLSRANGFNGALPNIGVAPTG